jgi:hypothetical protein
MFDYLLSYDLATSASIQNQLTSFVKEHKLIYQWSQPYQGLYLIKSSSDVSTLAKSFDEFFARQVLHVVCPISPAWTAGILPLNIWQWLRTVQETTTNALGFLSGHIPSS